MRARDQDCLCLLQWALPRLRMRWKGFRKVRGQVCKRMLRRCRALGLDDLAAYQEYLAAHQEEWGELDRMARITISRFYRNKKVFEALSSKVVPLLLERFGQLRCWSAGCCSGEEPYTLAILWWLVVAPNWPSHLFDVTATDVDETLLARAAAGVYGAGSLREIPAELRTLAFDRLGEMFALRVKLKRGVRFTRADLRHHPPDGPFELILCRNLAFTYYDDALQREVGKILVDRLVPGGALLVGSHEKPPPDEDRLTADSTTRCLYWKS